MTLLDVEPLVGYLVEAAFRPEMAVVPPRSLQWFYGSQIPLCSRTSDPLLIDLVSHRLVGSTGVYGTNSSRRLKKILLVSKSA